MIIAWVNNYQNPVYMEMILIIKHVLKQVRYPEHNLTFWRPFLSLFIKFVKKKNLSKKKKNV